MTTFAPIIVRVAVTDAQPERTSRSPGDDGEQDPDAMNIKIMAIPRAARIGDMAPRLAVI
jgi:hypothetical protein